MNVIEIIKSIQPFVGSALSAITGSILTAIFLRKNTSVEEFEKIKAERFDEAIGELLSSGKMSYLEYYKAKNYLSIAKKADEYYSKKETKEGIDSSKLDWDWFVRFYEAAGSISNEEMQNIWAKLLAGEVSEPSSSSYRTIDVLKNMSSNDAHMFEKICDHSFYRNNSFFLPTEDDYLEQANISFPEIMNLSELGIIKDDSFISYNVTVDTDFFVLVGNSRLKIVVKSNNNAKQTLKIDDYPFTKVGVELAQLINKEPNDEDVMCLAGLLRKNYKEMYINVHKVQFDDGKSIIVGKKGLIDGHEI